MNLLKAPSATASGAAPEIPLITEESESAGLSIQQIVTIVWAYRKQTIIIAAAITLLAGLVAKLMPKTYIAQATLMMSYEVNQGGKEYAINALGSYVATQIDLMQSSIVLLPVVDRLNLTNDKDFASGYNGEPNGLRSYVEGNLAKNLTIEQGRQGNQLLYVMASANDPAKAAKIANTVADVYKEMEVGWVNNPASERAKRYSEQLAELKSKVEAAQDAVTAYRQKTGIADMTALGQNDGEMQLLSSLEQKLQEAQNARRAAEAKQQANNTATSEVLGSLLVQNLKQQLSAQESQLAQLRTTYGPQHPKVLEQQSQIESTRKALATEVQNYSSGKSSELATALQLEQKMAAAVAQQRNKVLADRKLRDEGSKLVLELESAQSVYKRALDGYDQIMFASETSNAQRTSNVSFINRATPPVKAARPNKIKLLLMGMVAGCFFGLAGPLAFEFLVKRKIRCRDDIERDFGLPVLAEFDAVPTLQAAT